MLKNLKAFLLSSAACLFTLIAMSGVSTKSMLFTYEPDIPESIKRDL
ncbi:cyclic lactone autoinducer peptide [Paramaledivibacter caminithermalis]|jgi:cyclic lactone autoinducer peptide|uniref:Cyclic lactone autoinducer peptide n=1 Tax=Paramaledivibacter caminithermalis (strain DSM 15212 / CIP 107654 / DViRD3) TaxID=1121301 RepID=A0A1M6NMV1_PARC5|nr:cyclic lactone autoinducer peptide [Paramaledivibacter caminithermalis]SHJ97050.1 cyclic lactone autoinducer peptide [Paramaledivibacter caminithermalis DSM 15212]